MKLSNIIPPAVTALVVLASVTSQNANSQVVFAAPVPTVILPPPPVVVPEFTPLPIVPFVPFVPFVPVAPEINPCFPRVDVLHRHPFFIPHHPIFLRR